MELKEIKVKTVVNKHKKRDSWFLDDYSVNPYKLCDFHCVYCYIHGSKYGSRSSGYVEVKINAPEVLDKELRKLERKKNYGYIALSSATEPWMHAEERYNITRRCLEVIAKYRFPVHCLTKSSLIMRDADILEDINQNAILPEDLRNYDGVLITFSLSTLSNEVAKTFEVNAPSPKDRLDTVKHLLDDGFNVGIAYMPILPFISDSEGELEAMVKTAKELRISRLYFSPPTLYGKGKNKFLKVLERRYPDLVMKYREIYGNKHSPCRKYINEFYRKMKRISERYGITPIY